MAWQVYSLSCMQKLLAVLDLYGMLGVVMLLLLNMADIFMWKAVE